MVEIASIWMMLDLSLKIELFLYNQYLYLNFVSDCQTCSQKETLTVANTWQTSQIFFVSQIWKVRLQYLFIADQRDGEVRVRSDHYLSLLLQCQADTNRRGQRVHRAPDLCGGQSLDRWLGTFFRIHRTWSDWLCKGNDEDADTGSRGQAPGNYNYMLQCVIL